MSTESANSRQSSQPTDRDIDVLLAQLADHDVDPVVATLLETLVAERDRLQERIEQLEAKLERTHDIATTASGHSEANESRLDDLETDHEKTRDIARTAVAKAEQADCEETGSLPDGIEPSSSPLDFFANCRERTVKERFVEQSNRQNTYRAISVAKRWPEFGTERVDGSEIFFTKEDMTSACRDSVVGHGETSRPLRYPAPGQSVARTHL